MRDTGYTATEAAQIVGVTPRLVIDWGVRGFVEPGVKNSTGQGDRKIYSAENFVLMGVLRELFQKGLTRAEVGKLVESWRNTGVRRHSFQEWFTLNETVGVEWLVVIDNRLWFMSLHTGGHIDTFDSFLAESQAIPTATCVIAINLTAIKKEIRKKLN